MVSEAIELRREIDDQTKLALAVMLATRPAERSESETDPGVSESLLHLPKAAIELGLEVGELAELLNEPAFLKLIRGLTKARAELLVNGLGIERLAQVVAAGKDREALTAIKLLGQLTGVLRASQAIDININFEELMRRRNGTGGVDQQSIIDIFEIGEAERDD